jgi:hypothetical protein
MTMLKHFLLLIVASLIVILACSYVRLGLGTLAALHQWIIHALGQVLATGQLAVLLKKLLGLLIIPLALGGILEAIYWILKRGIMPYLFHVIWVTWLILLIVVS